VRETKWEKNGRRASVGKKKTKEDVKPLALEKKKVTRKVNWGSWGRSQGEKDTWAIKNTTYELRGRV